MIQIANPSLPDSDLIGEIADQIEWALAGRMLGAQARDCLVPYWTALLCAAAKKMGEYPKAYALAVSNMLSLIRIIEERDDYCPVDDIITQISAVFEHMQVLAELVDVSIPDARQLLRLMMRQWACGQGASMLRRERAGQWKYGSYASAALGQLSVGVIARLNEHGTQRVLELAWHDESGELFVFADCVRLSLVALHAERILTLFKLGALLIEQHPSAESFTHRAK
ncbi:hypothetical protein KSF73_15520 [Burkholderiaceae bacterium DAT-1]|nr:hypothetical protein [Burkholderiaceae bacterium DAT-1]